MILKHKSILICIGISIITFIILLFSLDDIKNNPYYSEGYVTTFTAPLGEITQGTIVEQTFTVKNKNLSSVTLLSATYARENTAGLTINLVDAADNESIDIWHFTASDIQDTADLNLYLSSTDNDFTDIVLKLCIYSNDGVEGNSYTFWLDDRDVYKDGSLYINGNETEKDLTLRVTFVGYSGHYVSSIIMSIIYSIVIGIISYVIFFKYKYIFRLQNYFRYIYLEIRNRPAKFLFLILIILALSVLSYLSELVISKVFLSSYFIWQRFLFILISVLSVMIIYIYRNVPEKTFFFLSLLIGIMFTVTLPISNKVCWDEDSHYPWAVAKAYPSTAYFNIADINYLSTPRESYYNKDLRKHILTDLNNSADTFAHYNEKELANAYSSVGHIPSGIGIFLGRLIGLPWSVVYVLGRLGNLFAYVFVIYFAIKRIIYGKYIIAVIGLIPTALFLASNYQYDTWVIAWLMLGVCYFLAELQEPDKKAKYSNLVIMLIAFVVGCGPKAVYFPLMFVLYFLGKDKFSSVKHYHYYRLIITASIIFVFASFALPFLVSGPGDGDSRGGSDVNATQQVSFVLSNPFTYIQILFSFMVDYMNPLNSRGALTFFAYLGHVDYNFGFLVAFILIVTLTDTNRYCKKLGAGLITATSLSVIASVVLIVTALYISFTPVGLSTVNGVQLRYLLPFICPVLLTMRSIFPELQFVRVRNTEDDNGRNYYSMIVFSISAFFLLAGFWSVCISRYH